MSSFVVNRILVLVAWAGVFVAGVLSVAHWFQLAIPCGAKGGCDIVQTHPSSLWLGIPVAAYGLATYLTLVGLALLRTLLEGSRARMLVILGLWVSGIGTLVSAYLIYYSVYEIKATCVWCISSAALMLLSFFLHAYLAQLDQQKAPDFDKFWIIGCGILAVGGVGLQSALTQKRAKGYVKISDVKGLTIEDIQPPATHFRGPKDAKVTVIEFADTFCPSCRRNHLQLEKLFEQSEGRMRWGFRHFPLYQKPGHELGLPAAMIAEYAATKGKFWDYLHKVMELGDPAATTENMIINAATGVGLELEEVKKVMRDDQSVYFNRVAEDISKAKSYHINETPTYFIFAEGVPPKRVLASQIEGVLRQYPYSNLLRPNVQK